MPRSPDQTDAHIGLRIAPEEEFTGLDLGEHNERGYNM